MYKLKRAVPRECYTNTPWISPLPLHITFTQPTTHRTHLLACEADVASYFVPQVDVAYF